jgi:hypothetical protein
MVRAAAGLPMAHQATRTLVHFEVQVLRGTRWTIELALEDGEQARARAREIAQQPAIDGVKVWQELHDPATGASAGRVILAEVKPRPMARRRRLSRTAAPSPVRPEPAPPRRPATAPPSRRGDWPLAGFSIGGACAALVALAVLAATG